MIIRVNFGFHGMSLGGCPVSKRKMRIVFGRLYNAGTPSKQAEHPDYLVGFATPARAAYVG
jgi:hypothetical protein